MVNITMKKHLTTKAIVGSGLLVAISIILTRVFSIAMPTLRLGFGDVPIIISGIVYGPFVGGITGAISDVLGYMINPMGGAYFPGFTVSAALRGIIPGLIYMIIPRKKTKFNFNIVNAISIIVLAIGLVNLLIRKDILTFEGTQAFINDEKLSIVYIIIYLVTVLAFIVIPILVNKKQNTIDSKNSLDKILFIVSITYIIISLGLNTLWLSMIFDKGFIILLPSRILAGLVIIPMHSLLVYWISKNLKHFI